MVQNPMWYISVNAIVTAIGSKRSKVLPMFHSLTVSFFCNRAKPSFFKAWEVFPEITRVLENLMKTPTVLTESDLSIIERFIVYAYSNCCEEVTVNEARMYLFTKKIRLIENLPPTQDALKQHSQSCLPRKCMGTNAKQSSNVSRPGTMRMEACE